MQLQATVSSAEESKLSRLDSHLEKILAMQERYNALLQNLSNRFMASLRT